MFNHLGHPFKVTPLSLSFMSPYNSLVAAPPAMAHKKRTRTYEDKPLLKDIRYDSVRRRAACSVPPTTSMQLTAVLCSQDLEEFDLGEDHTPCDIWVEFRPRAGL